MECSRSREIFSTIDMYEKSPYRCELKSLMSQTRMAAVVLQILRLEEMLY